MRPVISTLIWSCDAAPSDRAFLAMVTVTEGMERRICKEVFFGPSADAARHAALTSERVATEIRKIERAERLVEAREKRERVEVDRKVPAYLNKDALAVRRACVFDRLILSDLKFASVGREIGITRNAVEALFKNELRDRASIAREFYQALGVSEDDLPAWTSRYSHGKNLSSVRQSYPFLPASLRAVFDERARGKTLADLISANAARPFFQPKLPETVMQALQHLAFRDIVVIGRPKAAVARELGLSYGVICRLLDQEAVIHYEIAKNLGIQFRQSGRYKRPSDRYKEDFERLSPAQISSVNAVRARQLGNNMTI